MSILEVQTEIDVEFYDLDPMFVVWHGNYIKYLEIARTDLFEQLGYSYYDMIEDKISFPIATMDLKFKESAVFGQKLIVTSILEEYEPAVLIKYKIRDAETNREIFSAKSLQVGLDMTTKETRYNVPEKFAKKIKEIKK